MKENHFAELWRDTVPTEAPCPRPTAPEDMVRRVNAALDGLPSERRPSMGQKFRFPVVLAAVLAVLAGAALAVAIHFDVLDAFFQGDTSAAEALVDREVRSVSDKDYALTVESSVSDGETALLLVRVEALTEDSREFMFSDNFNGMDTWSVRPLLSEENDGSGAAMPNSLGVGYSEVGELRTESSTYWSFDVDLSGATALREYRKSQKPHYNVDTDGYGAGFPVEGKDRSGIIPVVPERVHIFRIPHTEDVRQIEVSGLYRPVHRETVHVHDGYRLFVPAGLVVASAGVQYIDFPVVAVKPFRLVADLHLAAYLPVGHRNPVQCPVVRPGSHIKEVPLPDYVPSLRYSYLSDMSSSGGIGDFHYIGAVQDDDQIPVRKYKVISRIPQSQRHAGILPREIIAVIFPFFQVHKVEGGIVRSLAAFVQKIQAAHSGFYRTDEGKAGVRTVCPYFVAGEK